MQHFFALEPVHLADAWLTIGSFDGIHQGHQKVLSKLVAGAHQAGVPAVVLTFYPHPAIVLRGIHAGYYLTTPEEKAALLAPLGVDVLITHPFNPQIAMLSAHQFVKRLYQHLQMRQLWVGFNFALGHNREGDIPALQKLGREFDFQVNVVPQVKLNGDTLSSTAIRKTLADGNVAQAAHWLGREYALSGIVEPGDGRGRTIGIPTANLAVNAERMLPGAGVYACTAEIGGQSWHAVTNVGVRPTFEVDPVAPRVEAHLLDFDRDIYGENMRLKFVARLRGERRFDSPQALVAQIHADIAKARTILAPLAR